MEIITHGTFSAALLEEKDFAPAKADPEAFLKTIVDEGCTGLIIPGKLISRALPLMKSGLLDTLRERFAHAAFRVAIVDMPGGLIASAVKTLIKAYKAGDSVRFTGSAEEAMALLASIPSAG